MSTILPPQNTPSLQPDILPPVNSYMTQPSPGRYMYSVFHTIMSLVAIYLSFKCNKGFEFGPFLVACCCPYIYIIYTLATKGICNDN